MAQYYTDFSELADTTALLAAWTVRWGGATWTLQTDAGATGGKILRSTDSGNGNDAGLSWNAVDADADRDEFETLTRYRIPSPAGSNTLPGCAFGRGSGSSVNCYLAGFRGSSATGMIERRVRRYLSGSGSNLSIDTSLDHGDGDWLWVRFRVNGTSLQMRTWTGGIGDEPGMWDIGTTDSEIDDAGWIGAFARVATAEEWDIFGVGTNGDTAPHEAVDPEPPAANIAAIAWHMQHGNQ